MSIKGPKTMDAYVKLSTALKGDVPECIVQLVAAMIEEKNWTPPPPKKTGQAWFVEDRKGAYFMVADDYLKWWQDMGYKTFRVKYEEIDNAK